jgi:hypothetical protein
MALMFCIYLASLLLKIFSCSTANDHENRAPSAADMAAVAANFHRILSAFQLPQESSSPCLPDINSEAALKSTLASDHEGTKEKDPGLQSVCRHLLVGAKNYLIG